MGSMVLIASTTTLSTGACHLSQSRIYPGRGTKYFAVNGKAFSFVNGKCKALCLQKKKPQEIRWTPQWRIAFRKLKLSTSGRNRKSKGDSGPRRMIAGLASNLQSKLK